MKSASIRPVNIVKIVIEYENGVRILVKEQKTPKIGKIFFDAIKKQDIEWEIIDPAEKKDSMWQKVNKFFKI